MNTTKRKTLGDRARSWERPEMPVDFVPLPGVDYSRIETAQTLATGWHRGHVRFFGLEYKCNVLRTSPTSAVVSFVTKAGTRYERRLRRVTNWKSAERRYSSYVMVDADWEAVETTPQRIEDVTDAHVEALREESKRWNEAFWPTVSLPKLVAAHKPEQVLDSPAGLDSMVITTSPIVSYEIRIVVNALGDESVEARRLTVFGTKRWHLFVNWTDALAWVARCSGIPAVLLQGRGDAPRHKEGALKPGPTTISAPPASPASRLCCCDQPSYRMDDEQWDGTCRRCGRLVLMPEPAPDATIVHHLPGEARVNVLCGCGWGRLGIPEAEVPATCPVCGAAIGGVK